MSTQSKPEPSANSSVNRSYCFKSSHYKDHLTEIIKELLEQECMIDLTLCVQGERIQVHRMVLCACSELFEEILNQITDEHPVIILNDVSAQDVKSIIKFIYYGEVNINAQKINEFLAAAHFLKIKRLLDIAGFDDSEESSETENFDDSDILRFDTSSGANLSDTQVSDSTIGTDIPLPSFCIENNVTVTNLKKTSSVTDVKKTSSATDIKKSSPITDTKKSLPTTDIKKSPQITNIKKTPSKAAIENSPSDSSSISPSQPVKRRRLSDTPLGIKLSKRKSSCKREYSDDQLEAAIADIREGKSLIDTASKHNIPRSTLYMRAKVLRIPLAPAKNDYTHEDMRAAIKLVLAGSSLQQAADCYGIPKTVLWRRIQKEGCYKTRKDKKTYPNETRQAAVKALEKGEPLCKVSQEYQIPKTTLFRDKTKLIDQGKLPSTMYKKRNKGEEKFKISRLEEAVAACKDGTMSQSAASIAYQIPKTTIWRRLHKEKLKDSKFDAAKGDMCATSNIIFIKGEENIDENIDESIDENFEDYLDQNDENMDADYSLVDENQINSESVIVLTHEDVAGLNIPNQESVVLVEKEKIGTSFISCGLELEENSENVIDMKFRMDS